MRAACSCLCDLFPLPRLLLRRRHQTRTGATATTGVVRASAGQPAASRRPSGRARRLRAARRGACGFERRAPPPERKEGTASQKKANA